MGNNKTRLIIGSAVLFSFCAAAILNTVGRTQLSAKTALRNFAERAAKNNCTLLNMRGYEVTFTQTHFLNTKEIKTMKVYVPHRPNDDGRVEINGEVLNRNGTKDNYYYPVNATVFSLTGPCTL